MEIRTISTKLEAFEPNFKDLNAILNIRMQKGIWSIRR